MNGAPDLDVLARAHHSILKQERATTVELLGTGDDAVVRKTYRNLGVRWLQTCGRRSRAQREFDNLLAVARTGARCTTAVAWSAQRRFACVDSSTLVTRHLPDSRTLKQVLATSPASQHHHTRASLVLAMGRLLAQLHRGGFLWGTAMPRNVLVLGDPHRAQLAVCDTPAGIDLRRSLHGGGLALIDLFDACFSPSRRADFSAVERFRCLLGYSDGDRTAARTLWRALARRSVLRHDAVRAIARTWHSYILLPLRRSHTRPPARAQ